MTETTTDRHVNPTMTLRIKPKFADAIRNIADAEDRTMTAIIIRAMRRYAEENGHEWPDAKQRSDDDE